MMSDKDKKRFQSMADRDKLRFDDEMQHYQPPAGGRVGKRKQVKDPNAPKRSLSAFFWFVTLIINLNLKHANFFFCSIIGFAVIFVGLSRSNTPNTLLETLPKSSAGVGEKLTNTPKPTTPPWQRRTRLATKG